MIEAALAERGLTPASIARHLAGRFSLQPRIGIEREFYLTGGDAAAFGHAAPRTLAAATDLYLHWGAEEGPGQFEYALRETGDLDGLVRAAARCDEALEDAARRAEGGVAWSALPRGVQPASGLHVHLSLHDGNGGNLLARPGHAASGPESPTMRAAIAGLLGTMRPLMAAFAPADECYRRLVSQPYPAVQFAPVSVSWGVGNRSVALRLPPCGAEPWRRRIEHRVASAAASLPAVLSAVLAGVWKGLSDGREPPWPRTLGLANDPRLAGPALPASRAASAWWLETAGLLLLDALAAEMGAAAADGATGSGRAADWNGAATGLAMNVM